MSTNDERELELEEIEAALRGDMRNEMKAAAKEAIKEWLDEKFATFGKWSLTTLAALGLAALVYFILLANGWKAPPP